MNGTCATPVALMDAIDYWAGDLAEDQADRLEAHLFACDECAAQVADVAALARAIAALARAGRFHATVTESVLNRLAREGVRIRSYAARPGQTVPCAVWSDDDLIVSRLQVDLTGVQSVAAVTYGPDGQPIARLQDIAVRHGQNEVIHAFPASLIRQLPPGPVRFALVEPGAAGDRLLGEYTFDHEGTLGRQP